MIVRVVAKREVVATKQALCNRHVLTSAEGGTCRLRTRRGVLGLEAGLTETAERSAGNDGVAWPLAAEVAGEDGDFVDRGDAPLEVG